MNEIQLFGNSDDLRIARYEEGQPASKAHCELLKDLVSVYKADVLAKTTTESIDTSATSQVSYFLSLVLSSNQLDSQQFLGEPSDSVAECAARSNEIVETNSPRTEGETPITAKSNCGRQPNSLVVEEGRVSSRLAMKAKTVGISVENNLNPSPNSNAKKVPKAVLIAQERASRKATNERIKEEKLAADKNAKEAQKVLRDHQAAIKREVDKAVKKTTASVTKLQQQHFKEEKEQRDQEVKRLGALVNEQAAELLSLKKARVHYLSLTLSLTLYHRVCFRFILKLLRQIDDHREHQNSRNQNRCHRRRHHPLLLQETNQAKNR